MEHDKLKRMIELVFLAIALNKWLSVLACLIRTDYNFPFAFFCYYLWINRDASENSLMVTLMILNGVLVLVDVIWLLSVGSIWTSEQKHNKVWTHLHGLHSFAIFISIINLLLKVGVIVAINMYRGQQKSTQQNLTQPGQPGMNSMNQMNQPLN